MDKKENNINITNKLQKLVKKRKTNTVIIKAGSVKSKRHSSSNGSEYYPSSFVDN